MPKYPGYNYLNALGNITFYRNAADRSLIIIVKPAEIDYMKGGPPAVYHRLDGPAMIWANGDEFWFVNGENITGQVIELIMANNYGPWKTWGDTEWVNFRLRFAG